MKACEEGDPERDARYKAMAVRTSKRMIHLDELEGGTWRLIYNGEMIPDFSKVEGLKIIRED